MLQPVCDHCRKPIGPLLQAPGSYVIVCPTCKSFVKCSIDPKLNSTPTNADHVRSLSDLELARQHATLFKDICPFLARTGSNESCNFAWQGDMSPCDVCALIWLLQKREVNYEERT